jgi:glycosyltransferase involved in cell wall biosynthesis
VVATNHEPYDHDVVDIYRRIASRIPVIAVSADQASRAPGDLDVAAVIHPGIDLDRYRLGAGSGDYLATLGKMRPSQGIDVAIEVARQAGLPLLIAARMRHQLERDYFTQVIEPQLGSGVEYLGEVDHDAKVQLLGGARALLNPVQQPEPFDLALVEAMACGTPVIATRTGSTPEIVTDSVNGFLATTNDQLVTAAKASRHLSRNDCHQQARLRFSMDTMAAEHESFYRSAILTHNAAAFGKHGRDGDRPPWND